MNDQQRDATNAFLDNADQLAQQLNKILQDVDAQYTQLQQRGDKLRQLITSASEEFAHRARSFSAQMRTLGAGLQEIEDRLNPPQT